jgi:ABC-type lipoprotein release transport system permease subunit
LQIRAASYDENKVSLDWKHLIASPQKIVDQLSALPQVESATPRLFATGIVTVGDQSRGVQVIGIDPAASASQIFRRGILAGDFLAADDRNSVLIGKPMADKLKMTVGSPINLLVNLSDGGVDQQLFTVKGIYTTSNTGYDENTVFLPLAKAQVFTGAQDHASTILVYLHDRDQAEAVAAAVSAPDFQVLTWQKMNELIVQYEDFANAYMVILYLIVLGITATVVTNTLVMAVFERTREFGVLAAIGMKGRRIMAQMLTEAGLLATGGVIVGLLLGILVVLYFTRYGIYVGNYGISGLLLGDNIYAYLTLQNVVSLTIATYVITLIASLYPAILAAQLEPIEALHAQ